MRGMFRGHHVSIVGLNQIHINDNEGYLQATIQYSDGTVRTCVASEVEIETYSVLDWVKSAQWVEERGDWTKDLDKVG